MKFIQLLVVYLLVSCMSLEVNHCNLHRNETLVEINDNNPRPNPIDIYSDYRIVAHDSLWDRYPNSLYISTSHKRLPMSYCNQCTTGIFEEVKSYKNKQICILHHLKLHQKTLFRRKYQISPSYEVLEIQERHPNSRPYMYEYHIEGDKDRYRKGVWQICDLCEEGYDYDMYFLKKENQKLLQIEKACSSIEEIKRNKKTGKLDEPVPERDK